MQNPKIFILLPDGVGLRNFSFTNFHKIGTQKGFDITFWNNTPFDLTDLGFKEIRFTNPKAHPLTDLLKNAQTQIELNLNIKKSKDPIYNHYRFPLSYKNIKAALKSTYIKGLVLRYNSEEGLVKIRKNIAQQERKTKLYHDSLATLQHEKPAMVFCTNQRMMLAVAPLLAAQDLGIPTATFIFSWDNLPKATKIIETDYYFVWSEHMKNELLYYYPYVKESQIIVSGTPQFEPHFEADYLMSKEAFFAAYHLDNSKKYLCFSGDDITTSPNDPTYLEDMAQAVKKLNEKGHRLGIIFRRCPVDFSNRFDKVLSKYSDLITPINPKWEKKGEAWHAILPTKDDLILQMNTIKHTELVINLGSSMVFDYAAFDKPCGYVNYEVKNASAPHWSVHTIYKFIHFRSMPNKETVFWINDPESMEQFIAQTLNGNSSATVAHAKAWFEKINQHPPTLASERIWTAIQQLIQN
ncbi:glycosyltransferase family protein [Flavobacterium sedimenticola]|uniref:UDP-glycosyltransferase n=1 Tax=Flavobacterium sedimenticola TaxID=3043286 RepID=A0ABT6XRF2_9FLAO|nr:UDP-glycosyltransferase [Flavobacterium sedimenticola]MDI9257667.1 UDP-glycosyltransferase [Flavobacterium sedimenticola]